MPNVLVIDDEAIIRMAFAECLLESGITPIQAGTGNEALAHLRGDVKIDLVVTDLSLPGDIQGPALIRMIQAEFPEMPIVVIGGDLSRLGDLQVSLTFAKPFNLQPAVETIKQMIESKK